jgi:predicted alpha-1,2-mannosidase
MKFLPFLLLSAFFISGCGNEKKQHVPFAWNVDSSKYDFAKYVNPMIGTAGHGHTFPGATAPFGMVQLSPDTRVDGSWDGCSGYHYDDDTIYGFSHTHLSGTGCSDYGDVLFMPGSGAIRFNHDAGEKVYYSSGFDHKNEKAEAGYYSVLLDNFKTKVELTASPRVGVHRYTFSKKEENWVMIDLKHRDEVLDSKIEIVNDHAVRGYRYSKAWATNQKIYFYAEFSKAIDLSTFSQGSKDQKEKQMIMSGKEVCLALSFKNPGNDPLIVKVALSPVSVENAQLNMETEVPGFDFDAVHKKVVQQWNNELGKIEVRSGDETKKRIFYTALYHCFVAPNLYCDVNGEYRGMDDKIHTDTIHPQYSVFSLWDTHRALHPLFTIIQPKRDQDFINTFVKQYNEGGLLPVWELSANETNCMIGYHCVPVIVDAWMKGLTDFDTATAYEAMKKSAMEDRNGLAAYKKYGFIPAEGESESVSKTLEYAYDDWCIAQAAKRMKKEDDYNYFMRRAQSWKNLYDPETGFFRPRLNNSFVQSFDPAEVNFHFTEANAWQYSLAVQQDIPGLIKAHGGDKKFIQFLDSLFSVSSKTSGRDQADITGLVGQYAQGNEPSHHMAYLYDYTSEPWKTQALVSRICNEMYTDKPDGLCGNEDCGQMSAWYVMSMLGIYQVTPGTGLFQVRASAHKMIVLHLENGKSIDLWDMVPPDKEYTDKPFFNGIQVGNVLSHTTHIRYDDLMSGKNIMLISTQVYDTGPDWKKWQEEDSTYFLKNNDYHIIPPVPRIKFAYDVKNSVVAPRLMRTFTSGMIASFVYEEGLKYFTSINNRPFTEQPVLFKIDSTSSIRAFSQDKFGFNSDTVEFVYTKIPGGRNIIINSIYANQYAAGGDGALIDGIRGSDNFRTGSWQGYEGKDIEAVVDLGSMKDISKIAIGCLQDQNSWIFLPAEVIFYSSSDGKNFTEIGRDKNSITQNTSVATLHDFSTTKATKARYVKVVAKNSGVCPPWHPGRGNPTWLFADEIVIETK